MADIAHFPRKPTPFLSLVEDIVMSQPGLCRGRRSMFRVEYGAIVWITVHGPVRFDLQQAKRFADILLEGGNSDIYFDLEDAILALTAPFGGGAA